MQFVLVEIEKNKVQARNRMRVFQGYRDVFQPK